MRADDDYGLRRQAQIERTMFEPMELTNDAVIKVIGVGGGGGNAVEHMVRGSALKVLNSSR